MKYILYIIIAILIIFNIYNLGKNDVEIKEIVKTDTMVVEKPIIIENLKHDTVYLTRYVKDTLYLKDSTRVEVDIPISTYEYNDSLHNIIFEGYKARISHFECKGKETIIYKEKVSKIKEKQPFITHGLQIGIGYGMINKMPDAYIGYGIQIKF